MKFVCQNKNLSELVLKCYRAFEKFPLLRMRTTVYSRILQSYWFDNFGFTNYTFTPYFLQIVAIIKILWKKVILAEYPGLTTPKKFTFLFSLDLWISKSIFVSYFYNSGDLVCCLLLMITEIG